MLFLWSYETKWKSIDSGVWDMSSEDDFVKSINDMAASIQGYK